MSVLSRVTGPADLRGLGDTQLAALADEVRELLIDRVGVSGGHLGPNLGVVELTIALHRVFDSPRDQLVFDVGHQAYVHKLLTGRRDFSGLRQRGGLSGYPSRAESAHDVLENQHASAGLSWADGLAAGHQLHHRDAHVVAVVGDGALTGGMVWEALNNIAAAKTRPLVIVINDNQYSYSPTTGGLADALATLRTQDGYEQALGLARRLLESVPAVGRPLFEMLRAAKHAVKTAVAPQAFFEDLGLKYVGPVDGHDRVKLEQVLAQAKSFTGPVIVHAVTEKGRGYPSALDHDERFHQVKAVDPASGTTRAAATPDWTSAFSQAVLNLGATRPNLVTVTAAMTRSTGLEPFARTYPPRAFDVGIAEQHAAASAAGLATAGLHPVVAIYSTFVSRCYDQILMDIALHHCGVTLCLDRAGITGDDGAAHNGIWDLALLRSVPGLRIAAPRDAQRLRESLTEAVDVDDAPTVLRYPKGPLPAALPAVATYRGLDVLHSPTRPAATAAHDHMDTLEMTATDLAADVVLVGIGPLAAACVQAAHQLAAEGITSVVVDPRWAIPVPNTLAKLAAHATLVVTAEDGIRTGGVGTAISQALRDHNVATPTRELGVPAHFFDHATREHLLAQLGLTAPAIADQTSAWQRQLQDR